MRQVYHWLSSLAYQISRSGQSLFYLEKMQPDWLLFSSDALRRYRLTVERIIYSVIAVVMCVLYALFRGEVPHQPGLFYLITLWVLGIFFGTKGAFLRNKAQIFSKNPMTKSHSRDQVVSVMLFCCCGGISLALVYAEQARGSNVLALAYEFITGEAYGLLYGLGNMISWIPIGDIQPVELVSWSWPSVYRNLAGAIKQSTQIAMVILGVMVVSVVGISSLFYGPMHGLWYGCIYGCIAAIIVFINIILAHIFVSGWLGDTIKNRQQMQPNEGIHRSLRNALFAALVFGSLGGIVSGVFSALAFWSVGVQGLLIFCEGISFILSMVFYFLFFGGVAVIQHVVLCWYLWRKGMIPRNYIEFLDYAVQHRLLDRIGSGYMFPHQLYQEHLASKFQPNESE